MGPMRQRRMRCDLWPAFGLCVFGCAGREPSGESGSTNGDAETTGVDTTSTGAAPTTTGTSGPEAGSSSGAEGSTGADPICPPVSPASFDFNIVPMPDGYAPVVDWDCAVLDKLMLPTGATLQLQCTENGVAVEPPPQLTIDASPPPPSLAIEVGELVRLRYAQNFAPWTYEKSIRVDGADQTLLIAGIDDGSPFDPFEGVLIDPFAPLCGPEEDSCGLVQHGRVGLTIDGVSGDVQSRDFTEIGAYGVWAPFIWSFVDGPDCSDVGYGRFTLDLVRLVP